jgi:hypothetical protein
MITGLKDCECRASAVALLDELLVEQPSEIDVETLAWLSGQLTIETGGLDNADGRLTANTDGGVIRVRAGLSEGRHRFVVAHEIGHRRLHRSQPALDTPRELSTWTDASKETEANVFASELLMPGRLFEPKAHGAEPSLSLMEDLAGKFRTSMLAAATQFIHYTREPCALFVTVAGKRAWFRKSQSFGFVLHRDKPHGYSVAGEILKGLCTASDGPLAVPAGAWIEGFDPKLGKEEIMEDAVLYKGLDMIVSLLWVRDEI